VFFRIKLIRQEMFSKKEFSSFRAWKILAEFAGQYTLTAVSHSNKIKAIF